MRIDQNTPEFRRSELLARVRELEKAAGPRMLRDGLLELLPADSPTRTRIEAAEAAIAELRKQL